ncbi:hypothetical protein C7S18_22865 [Ahniella affigens]|uniref:DUF6916 domain-containing protein n=1 Tax=Ahniella affigens TaxID=2021234 RepID=A0A2P1PYB9_9GAMM|nr:hypothetical protein [Ahniella affigens]AVP99842.1 hypothetical protein C7S18_22865 [Ahniella affigens]
MLDLQSVAPEQFDAALNTAFNVSTGGSIQLIEVVRLKSPSPRPQAFSLTFSHPSAHLPQGIYELEHESLGKMAIFLTPIQPDKRGRLFEAVFN